MSAKCPSCAETLLHVKCYSIDIESSGALQSGTAFACPACSAAISISLGAPPIVAGIIQETVADVVLDINEAHPEPATSLGSGRTRRCSPSDPINRSFADAQASSTRTTFPISWAAELPPRRPQKIGTGTHSSQSLIGEADDDKPYFRLH
jgi:hypothetical protein